MTGGGGGRAGPSPRAELLAAIVLLAFGLAVIALAWRMPTFAEQSGTGLTAPGIVPGFHGAVIAVLAILLGLRAVRAQRVAPDPQAGSRGDATRLLLAASLGALYAGVLVGRLPFWLATALFVFTFTASFEFRQGSAGRLRRLLEAAALAIGTGILVTLVFQKIFLVRLP